MNAFELLGAIILAVVIATLVMYFVSPATLFRWLIAVGRKAARVTLKTVDVDGIAWPYLEGGPADGQVMLLVHGFGGEKDHWLAYVRFFSKRFRVIVPDLPGFGVNTRSKELDYGVGAQAERLDRFLDALSVGKCHVAGNSMGGYILLKLALNNPVRLISLTLLNNAGVHGNKRTELLEAIRRGENLLKIESVEDIDRSLALATYKPPHIPRRFQQVLFEQTVIHTDFLDGLFHQIGAQWLHSPMNDELPGISTPTLVIWGRHDRLVDVSCVDVLQEYIPDCDSVIFENAGHIPMVEIPAETARHHIAFLDRQDRTPSA